jgi:hypothetical protein
VLAGVVRACDPNATSPPQIHEVVGCGTPPGAVITSTNIKSDPAYAGGLIGFALARGPGVGGCVSSANPGSIAQIVVLVTGLTCPPAAPFSGPSHECPPA